MLNTVLFCSGLLTGLLIAYILYTHSQKNKTAMTNDLSSVFSALSEDIMKKNTEQFLTLANEKLTHAKDLNSKELTEKKSLIDQSLTSINKQMKDELTAMQTTVKNLEKDREKKFGELSEHLKLTNQSTQELRNTTQELNQALSNSKTRGQWGERMAEDVLQLIDLKEGINYVKQKTMDHGKSIPDFTFFLPDNKKVNMDVKFPLTNYLNFLNANEFEKPALKLAFIKDIKDRIKEVSSRDYINPEENTTDFVLAFIPNEQIYAFIQENDLIDDKNQPLSIVEFAMRNKVILCSPLTLYALLGIIHHAIKAFSMEQTSKEMLGLMEKFHQQWGKFTESMDKVETRFESVRKEFTNLITTRKTQLEKPLEKIKELPLNQATPQLETKPLLDANLDHNMVQ